VEGAESPRAPSLPSFPPLPQGRQLRRGRLRGNEHAGAEEPPERNAPSGPSGSCQSGWGKGSGSGSKGEEQGAKRKQGPCNTWALAGFAPSGCSTGKDAGTTLLSKTGRGGRRPGGHTREGLDPHQFGSHRLAALMKADCLTMTSPGPDPGSSLAPGGTPVPPPAPRGARWG
jgi:hypothetical protein